MAPTKKQLDYIAKLIDIVGCKLDKGRTATKLEISQYIDELKVEAELLNPYEGYGYDK